MEEKRPEENRTDEVKPETNEAWKNKARPTIYALAGVYLVYLSHAMFKQISTTSGSEQMLMIVCSILFAVIGLGGILFGLVSGYKNTKKER